MSPNLQQTQTPSRITNPLPQLFAFRAFKALQRVRAMVWERKTPVEVWGSPDMAEMLLPAAGMALPLSPMTPGEFFGKEAGPWGQRWMKVEIPTAAADEAGRRFLLWSGTGEITAYRDGVPWFGIDWAHKECPLPDEACTLWLCCGLWEKQHDQGILFTSAEIGVLNELAWQTSFDLEILCERVKWGYKDELDHNMTDWGAVGLQPKLEKLSPFMRQLLRGLDDAVDVLDNQGLAAFRDALAALYARFPAEAWQPVAAMHGHAHIDVVWLWPEVVVQHKAIHTFATQLRWMERYPEFTFTQSQPALYRAVERMTPELMPQIRQRIAEGRWEATGALEVELDTQLPCGESMARSLLYGQRKFRELRNGQASTVCWIPDVFGYSACLPQILKLGGVPGFFTTKMTWSTITKFPYNSFVWRGSDGSEVLAHLCTTTYIGQAHVEEMNTALNNHQQSDVHPAMLLPSGWGDGGGGMAIDAMERARRLANLGGVPKGQWTTVERFFAEMEEVRDRLPVYQGELYLEIHRGTYTTQSEFKRLHRTAERSLQLHEAARVLTGGAPLGDEAWLRVLLCQFHDALPGSSITIVYQELNAELQQIIDRELAATQGELISTASGLLGTIAGLTAFNSLPVPRTAVVEVPADADLPGVPTQTSGEKRLAAVSLPALGAYKVEGAPALPAFAEVSPTVLDNGVLRAEFDGNGQLAALTVDGEPLLLDAPAHFSLYYDEPHMFGAWDIDHYVYKNERPAADRLSLAVVEQGPLRAVLRGTAPVGEHSTLTIDYILETGSRWLRVEAEVDWRANHQLLRYTVPSGYRGRFARFGNPFGSIQRPQLPGGQQDEAMWEVPGNRWAAVTHDDGIGLALVTEAKYGFSCKDGVLGLSLLRSPVEPDPQADRGQHRLRFALSRHEACTRGDIPATPLAADTLFTPVLIVANGTELPAPFTLADLGSLTPSWVLPAETEPGYLIRLHETNGSAGVARLHLATPARMVSSVDFLEQTLTELPQESATEYLIPYAPYQIVSILVR